MNEGRNCDFYCGRMNDPTASSFLTGSCGDAMEFYLVIENGIVTEIKYYTDGCAATKACGASAASLAEGKQIEEVMLISPGMILKKINGLPSEHRHCAILAPRHCTGLLPIIYYKNRKVLK